MRRCIGLAAVLLATACAQPAGPPSGLAATLPFEHAGIADMRPAFAQRLGEELARRHQDPDPSRWLHHSARTTAAGPVPFAAPEGLQVLIVPGLLGDCVDDQSLPFSDGRRRTRPDSHTQGYAHLRATLGHVRALQVPGRASSARNAGLIAAQLHAEALRPEVREILLIAYSKGVADTLLALDRLQREGRLSPKVRALVSVSGAVMGTPLADGSAALYGALAPLWAALGCPASGGGEIRSLATEERASWLARHRLPPGVRTYSVVAYTARKNVAPALVPFFDRLSASDRRNDGQIPAGRMLLPGSRLLAEADADHWAYVLPLAQHPNPLVRHLAASRDYPREAFLAAIVRTVIDDLRNTGAQAPAFRAGTSVCPVQALPEACAGP